MILCLYCYCSLQIIQARFTVFKWVSLSLEHILNNRTFILHKFGKHRNWLRCCWWINNMFSLPEDVSMRLILKVHVEGTVWLLHFYFWYFWLDFLFFLCFFVSYLDRDSLCDKIVGVMDSTLSLQDAFCPQSERRFGPTLYDWVSFISFQWFDIFYFVYDTNLILLGLWISECLLWFLTRRLSK